MSNPRDNDVDYLNRRGFLKLEAISRTVIWTVENYHSLLISEHSICSNTFRVPTLPSCLFYMCLSLQRDLFSLNVISIIKNQYSFLRNTMNSVIKISIFLEDTVNQIELSKELIMPKDNILTPINFDKNVSASNKCLNKEHLEVRCTVTVSDTENFSSLQKTEISHKFEDNYIPSISTSELKDHLQVILDGDEDNHVTLIVGEDAFQVHRTILCSHSSVFTAMFEHDTSEKNKNQIYIDDISVETIGEILSFMYFGSTSKLSYEKAMDIYTAADKYAIMNLKRKCCNFLISSLTRESVLDVLIMADRHFDEALKESATKFLVNETADIIKSDEFLSFVENEPELARYVILHLLKHIPK
ncbi:speckle-type POZ protein [Caerostris darwini]|uniref:Speckle-type POZ protein n=1 Tax=Caerostris darwini TaxID=1538125 RepID=A0AAV4TGT4_9ARAC|nr:speckle-type POZ protein [Caerostris darwini]